MPGQIEHILEGVGDLGIPNFALYGEAGGAPFPDVLHCESIAARASLHDWRIAPHRHHNLHQFFWVDAGGGEVTIEGKVHDLAPAAAITLPPMSVHGFHFLPGTEGWVVTLPMVTLEQLLADAEALHGGLAASALIRPAQSPLWIFEAVAAEYSGADTGRAKALSCLVGLLATWFARALASQAAREAMPPRAGPDLLARFRAMVEKSYRDPPPLSDYAEALGVTPTHLSRVCRSLTGSAASRLILERRLLEARRALAYTSMQIAEIAYMLGYSDPAYFARVFAQAAGESPSAFRARMTTL